MPRISDEVKFAYESPPPWMIWLYGDFGGGKTVLACGAPHVLLLDTEGSRRSLLNHPELVRTKFLEVPTYERFVRISEEIILGRDEIVQESETILVDTVSTLQMKDLNAQMKIVGGKPGRHADLPSEAEFNINNTRLRRTLLDLKERSGKNIVLISHIKEDKDDQGQTILIRPGNSPSISTSIANLCDGIFYLTSRTDMKGGTTRTLRCMPAAKHWSKNRFSSSLEKDVVNPTWKDIQTAIDTQLEIARQYAESENLTLGESNASS